MGFEDDAMSDPAALPAPPPGGWTYADYAALPDDGRRYQVLEGELVVTPGPNLDHQELVLRLSVALLVHVEAQRLGSVFPAPTDVLLDERTILQPDVLFVAAGRGITRDRLNVKGAPDLCVEILSPSTKRLDRLRKLHLYARFGVAHYWIVDPEARSTEELVLDGDVYRARSVTPFDAPFRPALFPGLEIVLGHGAG